MYTYNFVWIFKMYGIGQASQLVWCVTFIYLLINYVRN